VFLASFLGAFLHKKIKLDLRTMTELIVYLGAPCLTFTTISSHQYEYQLLGQLVLAMLALFVSMFVMTRIFFFKTIKQNKTIYLTTCFMNTAGMGFPVTLLILGQEAFSYAVILDLTMIVTIFTFGVVLVDKKSGFLGPLKLPVIYAAALGFASNYFAINIPAFLAHVIEMIGNISIPLLLISLGARLSELKIEHVKLLAPIKATAVRMIGGLLVGLVITGLTAFPALVDRVFILYSVLPAPLMSYVLASKYRQNDVLAAEIILMSTATSFIMIPAVLYFF